MKKIFLKLAVLPVLLCFSLAAHAAAPNLSYLWLYGATSAWYNSSIPPNPEDLNWDRMPYPGSLSANWPEGGGWVGFWTAALGYYSAIYANYNGSPTTWYTQRPILDSSGLVIGWSDFWYCGCTGGASFNTTAYGINGGSRYWNTYIP